jgi:hypothetical protein
MPHAELNRTGVEALEQMHARYVLDTGQHEEYIEIMPVGTLDTLAPGEYSYRIDLPVGAPPHCELKIGSRCVTALQRASYPHAPGSKPSGRVILTGTITRGGGIGHVRAVKTESVPAVQGDLLAHAAVQDLSSWRLEPGPREEAIRITYSYVIDRKLKYDDTSAVNFALPNEVTIRGSPLDCEYCEKR